MVLDMYGFVTPDIASTPPGGVTLVRQGPGDYQGPGGQWQAGSETTVDLADVVIQSASMKTAEFLSQVGGVARVSDLRVVYLNDGIMIQPDDNGEFSDILRFSDGQQVRDWRVREVDNRPWHNYCKAIVERYRGER